MNSHFTLLPDAVTIADCADRDAILANLAECLARAHDLDRDLVIESLDERERLGSTGFGRGVAIPHARIEGLRRPVSALMRLREPVDFNSADGLPVELVFGLLSPANAGATHLYALAAISRLTRDEEMREALIAAPDADALYALIANLEDRDAA